MKSSQNSENLYSDLVSDLVCSQSLQRLSEISFLGAIDALAGDNPGRSGTRLEHSLGVAKLAQHVCSNLQLKVPSVKLAIACAILHDVGHSVLSHSVERAFSKHLGINHRMQTAHLIQHNNEISRILNKYEISKYDVISTLFYDSSNEVSHLFQGRINIDTIEGITRSASFFMNSHVPPVIFSRILYEIDDLSIFSADLFWRIKDKIYNNYIFDPNHSLYDRCVSDFVIQNDLLNLDFYWATDLDLTCDMFSDLCSRVKRVQSSFLVKDASPKNFRRFVVDGSMSVDSLSDIEDRYKKYESVF